MAKDWFRTFGAPSPIGQGGSWSTRGHGFGPPSGVNNPKCTPRSLGFTDKHALTKTLVRYNAVGDGIGQSGVTVTPVALVYNPSNRLRCIMVVSYEADDQSATDPTFDGDAPNWSIRPMQRNPETGRETSLQVVYPASGTQNVPDSYEVDTNIPLIRVSVLDVRDTGLKQSYVPTTARCSVILTVQWEPSVEMPKAERDALYAQCQVSYGAPIQLVNNAQP